MTNSCIFAKKNLKWGHEELDMINSNNSKVKHQLDIFYISRCLFSNVSDSPLYKEIAHNFV